MKIAFLITTLLTLFHLSYSYAQPLDCDMHTLLSKYWQYDKQFHEKFIKIDRDSSGCINDGIGADPNNPCSFS
ncbi:MAG TPA: hypothetical protein PK006_04520 [Saprospiraceae bacterium]|nr:hypothetical protein [Saprospiraceae bacterium]